MNTRQPGCSFAVSSGSFSICFGVISIEASAEEGGGGLGG